MAEEKQAEVRFNNASDFNTGLALLIKDYCEPYNALRDALTNVRLAGTVDRATMGQDIPQWPYETCFVSMEPVVGLYNMMYERGVFDNIPADMEDSQLMEFVQAPSILAGCFAWEKVHSIINIAKHDFENSLLDIPSATLAQLPQWAVCINGADLDLTWDDKKVMGVIFYRYFFAASQEHPGNSLGNNEAPATINNINSLVIFADGSIELGPFISMESDKSINEQIDAIACMMKEQSNLVEDSGNKDIPALIAQSSERSRAIFSYLVYFLQHQGSLKNGKGDSTKLKANPEPKKVKHGYRIFSESNNIVMFLD